MMERKKKIFPPPTLVADKNSNLIPSTKSKCNDFFSYAKLLGQNIFHNCQYYQ